MGVVVHNCPFISCLIFELELNRKPMLQTCIMSFDYIHKKTNRLCAMCFSYDMTLEFSAVIFGAEKEFELSHLETCEVCSGTGAKIGSKMRICSTCGGRGQVMRTEQTPFGLFSQVTKTIIFLVFMDITFFEGYNLYKAEGKLGALFVPNVV